MAHPHKCLVGLNIFLQLESVESLALGDGRGTSQGYESVHERQADAVIAVAGNSLFPLLYISFDS